MNIRNEYERWLTNAFLDADIIPELKGMDESEIEDAFFCDLSFGTGGLRGLIGAGTNRMNVYTVAKASQGLSDYINKRYKDSAVVTIADLRVICLQKLLRACLWQMELRYIFGRLSRQYRQCLLRLAICALQQGL